MTPTSENKIATSQQLPPAPVRWRGESGRFYALASEDIEGFTLNPDDLYLIAEGNHARWIGTAADLVADIASRGQFRAALKLASAVLRMAAPINEVERMRVVYDLEHGGRAGCTLSLAG